MRSLVLILAILMGGFCVAKPPTDERPVTSPEPKSPVDSGELLAHIKAPKPSSNEVSVIVKKNQTIEEYRLNGELVMVKVIPTDGVPYYIDPQIKNKRTGAHSDLINSGVEPVYWVIKRF